MSTSDYYYQSCRDFSLDSRLHDNNTTRNENIRGTSRRRLLVYHAIPPPPPSITRRFHDHTRARSDHYKTATNHTDRYQKDMKHKKEMIPRTKTLVMSEKQTERPTSKQLMHCLTSECIAVLKLYILPCFPRTGEWCYSDPRICGRQRNDHDTTTVFCLEVCLRSDGEHVKSID